MSQPKDAAAPQVPVVGVEAAGAPSPAAAVPAVSGLYTFTRKGAQGGGVQALPSSGELRLDVDGRHPLATASGELRWGTLTRVHWVASLRPDGPNRWRGQIWYRDGAQKMLPHTAVRIEARAAPRSAVLRFGGGGAGSLTLACAWSSPFFRPVELEVDRTADANAVLAVRTGDHPNRPASLPLEEITLSEVFRRAGFEVRGSGGDGTVPLARAAGGAGPRWSNAEMHDAMQAYWSRFAQRAQWSMWVFFAALHEDGDRLGGIMFDYTGARQRQGTAIFTESFIRRAPAGDAAAAAWVRRMRFWTACHEMGHCFNLAHSWDKAGAGSWIPLEAVPEERSFMNYPYEVEGGQTAFFSDFAFRFGDAELLSMRHAPERFVQMGNAAWGDHHALEDDDPEPRLRLTLRVNRAAARFQFMEPPVCELKLTNAADEPALVDPDVLRGNLTVLVQRDGAPARLARPVAQYCWKAPKTVLHPGESLYETLFAGVDRDGWMVAEPGWYTVKVALRSGGRDVVSNALRLRVDPPVGYDEELVAQDFFTGDVGRVLAFDGSRFLEGANDTLRAVVERFPGRKVTAHARVALAAPLTRPHKRLDVTGGLSDSGSAAAAGGRIDVIPQRPDEARRELQAALLRDADASAESLAHVDYRYYVDLFSDFLAGAGERRAAAEAQQTMHDTLRARRVKPAVLREILARRDELAAGYPGPRRDRR